MVVEKNVPFSKVEALQFYLKWAKEQLKYYSKHYSPDSSQKDILAEKFKQQLSLKSNINIESVDTYNSVEELDYKDYIDQYVKLGKPVVIKGVAQNWKCVQNWSLGFFENNYGSETLPFLETGTDKFSYREKDLRSICNEIRTGSTNYAKFSNLLLKYPSLLDDFDLEFIRETKAIKFIDSSVQLFIGGPNTTTNLHTAISNVSFIQVFGTKKWLTLPKEWTPLVNPQIDDQPQFMANQHFNNLNDFQDREFLKKIPFKEVILEPGDFFFNPAYNWHCVENTTTSIGVAFRWVPYRALIQSPTLTFFVFLKQLSSIFNLKQHTKGNYFPEKWP